MRIELEIVVDIGVLYDFFFIFFIVYVFRVYVIVIIQLIGGVYACVSCKVYLIVFCVLHSKYMVHSAESGMGEGNGCEHKNIYAYF